MKIIAGNKLLVKKIPDEYGERYKLILQMGLWEFSYGLLLNDKEAEFLYSVNMFYLESYLRKKNIPHNIKRKIIYVPKEYIVIVS